MHYTIHTSTYTETPHRDPHIKHKNTQTFGYRNNDTQGIYIYTHTPRDGDIYRDNGITHKHTYIHIYTKSYGTHTYIHTCIHIHIHKYIHAYIQ